MLILTRASVGVSVCGLQGTPGDNTTRVEIRSPEYMQIVIYDHLTRRKTG